MNGLIRIPLNAITALTSEPAVKLMRDVLRTECRYGRLSPSALTISSRITIADGGIDAEVNTSAHGVPPDCIFQAGLTGFQIKSGTSFKPWTGSSIKAELLDSKGRLFSEVENLAVRRGRYSLICTGHDLTPEQRNIAFAILGDHFFGTRLHLLGQFGKFRASLRERNDITCRERH